MVMANSNKDVLKNFNKLSQYLNKIGIIGYKEFKKEVINIMGKNWKDDVEDLAYFYESLKKEIFIPKNYIELIKDETGIINSIKILDIIPKIDNFNDIIIFYFSSNILGNII